MKRSNCKTTTTTTTTTTKVSVLYVRKSGLTRNGDKREVSNTAHKHVSVIIDLDGDVAQLVERRTGRFDSPVRQGIFLPESTFGADSLTVSVHPVRVSAIACINSYAHVKDPVVHFRFRWIMEILKHSACNVGWVVRLCRSRLSP